MTKKSFKSVRVPRGNAWNLHRLGVMMETMNDNIMLLAEGQDVLEQRLSRVEAKVEVNTEMIASLTEDVRVLQEDMQEVKKELAKKADKDDVLLLHQRLSALEVARA